MTPKGFRAAIIDPTLHLLDLWSPAASNLMLGTALVESGLEHRKQIGGGPARGYFQIEPATFHDVYGRHLKTRQSLLARVNSLLTPLMPPVDQLWNNDQLGCAIARIRYRYAKEPLPDAEDAKGLAEYHKKYYNTSAGKTDTGRSIKAFEAALARSLEAGTFS